MPRASARHTACLEREIWALTEKAEAQGMAEYTPSSTTDQADHTNVQLLEEIQVLKNQMSAMQQQQQQQMQAVMDQGLPEYTVGPT